MEKIRLNLYTEDKDTANDFLISEFGENAENTFGVPRTLNGKTVYVCSWYLDLDDAAKISAIIPETIKQVEDFKDFGYLDD